MTSKKKPPKGPSRKTEQPAGQPKSLPQAPTQGASAHGQRSRPARRQKGPKHTQTTVLPRTKRHTRTSQGSPLLEERKDINKLTGKSKQKPKKSTRTVESAPRAEPLFERQHRYRDQDTLPSSLRPLPSIETASEANREGQRTQSELGSTSSRDLRSEEDFRAYESTDSEIVPWSEELPDAEGVSLQRSGYIVSLSNEALAAIHVILGMEAAKKIAGISPYSPEFGKTLKEDRNVLLKETRQKDPEWVYLNTYQFNQEADEASIVNFLDKVWLTDLRLCKDQQEAIFQRTIMMDMINRHQLIFSIELSECALVFSVEAPWVCDPMPTARFEKRPMKLKTDQNEEEPKIYTNPPRPDLCVSFRTNQIVDAVLWKRLPPKTQHLICYEGIKGNETERAFGFLFVEAKRSRLQPDDNVALYQALNDASQALHNLYEFFKEAGQDSVFFDRVRVFSATASEKGVILRVHWAVKLPEDTEMDRITENYPLQFEHQTYQSFRGENFNRLKVVEAFERIVRGYGENQLLKILQKAAASVKNKVDKAWRNRHLIPFSTAFNDYRYGQSGKLVAE